MVQFKVTNEPVNMSVEKTDVVRISGSAAIISDVALLASEWVGQDKLYSQVVNIKGVTKNNQVDLTPDVEQLLVFHEKDLTFVTENDNGIVTVYAIGQKPTNDYTIQVTISEVIAEGKIIGITVGTPISIQQIKEKINPITSVNGVEADNGGNVNIEMPNVMTDEEIIKLQSALQ